MSDRVTAHDGKMWVDGIPLEGYFTMTVRNEVDASSYGDAIRPGDLAPEVSMTKVLTVEDEGDRQLLQGLGAQRFMAEFEVEREPVIPPGTTFALWGARKRDVQVGSWEDHMMHATKLRVTVPNVELARDDGRD